jgi:hypothetical protein
LQLLGGGGDAVQKIADGLGGGFGVADGRLVLPAWPRWKTTYATESKT